MCKVIAICNQKGGVSKTTTTANLGVGLVGAGKEVLVIDADPQGNLSQRMNWKLHFRVSWSRSSWTRRWM